jgi:hypothetical protein
MRITSSRLLSFLEPITVELSAKQRNHLAQLLEAYFTSRQLRVSALARGAQSSGHLSQGGYEACYKATQRFLERVQVEALHQALWRLLPSSAVTNRTSQVTSPSAVRPYVLLDITEVERPEAYHTSYVGTLKDGKTKGFWLMVLGSPYQGRMLPFAFRVFSSRTLGQDVSSRNLEHHHLLSEMHEWAQDRVLVADREFSYEELLRLLVEEQMPFVIRLNTGNKVRLTITPDRPGCPGEAVRLALTQGQTQVWPRLYYKGVIPVTVAAIWRRGLRQPLFVMTNVEGQEALAIYHQRMKIEQGFRDLKTNLGLEQNMSKQPQRLGKLLAIALVGYALGVLIGEQVRSHVLSASQQKRYSGFHVFLHSLEYLPRERVRQAVAQAEALFLWLVDPPAQLSHLPS